jgi:hypothetical protein
MMPIWRRRANLSLEEQAIVAAAAEILSAEWINPQNSN